MTFNPWQPIATEIAGPNNGKVVLRRRTYGDSKLGNTGTIFLVPGMEGSGESCVHLVEQVLLHAVEAGLAYHLDLIDYSAERCGQFDELARAVNALMRTQLALRASTVKVNSAILWAQSFGNLLALAAASLGDLQFSNAVLVSPFTNLPPWTLVPAVAATTITPTPLYRATIGPIARYLFGPAGDQPEHAFFAAMKRADAPTVHRRIAWLKGADFSSLFVRNKLETTVFLGTQDRLIDLQKQRNFFSELPYICGSYRFAEIAGSGHVVLPSNVVARAAKDIYLNLFKN